MIITRERKSLRNLPILAWLQWLRDRGSCGMRSTRYKTCEEAHRIRNRGTCSHSVMKQLGICKSSIGGWCLCPKSSVMGAEGQDWQRQHSMI